MSRSIRLESKEITPSLGDHCLQQATPDEELSSEAALGVDSGMSFEDFLKVKKYMEANLADTIRIADLALLVHMSESTFTRSFKKYANVSPYQFLVNLRVLRSKQQIADGVDLASVALTCGFADQAHLTRVFKARTGVTPTYFK